MDWIECVGERERERKREQTHGKVRYELLRRITHLLISHASAPEMSSCRKHHPLPQHLMQSPKSEQVMRPGPDDVLCSAFNATPRLGYSKVVMMMVRSYCSGGGA